jgi:hypothetical protein
MFPGDGDQSLDLIPADFAAAAIGHLFGPGFVPGRTYHVCAGAQRSFTIESLFPAVDAFLAAADPNWRRRGQALPLRVCPEVFRDFVDIVELTANPRLRQIIDQVSTVTRQLEVTKAFDTRGFDRATREATGLTLPHARDWLEPSVARAVATTWQQPARAIA